MFGVWLTGDYRVLPPPRAGIDTLELTYALIGVVAAAGLLGVAWLVRRRALAPLLFLAVSLIALVYVTRSGSPWADAKALAIASPAVLLMAALGPLALEARGARLEALGLAVALAVGVLASNAFVYHDVEPRAARAPRRARRTVAERTDGRGPLLYTEFEEFAKHFLRDSDPVGASEAFTVSGADAAVTRDGTPAKFGYPVELSALRAQRTSSASRSWCCEEAASRRAACRVPARVERALLRDLVAHARRATAAGAVGRSATPAELPDVPTAERRCQRGWTRRDRRSRARPDGRPGRGARQRRAAAAGRYELWLRGSFGREVECASTAEHAGSAA